jgi:hypothetical protein
VGDRGAFFSEGLALYIVGVAAFVGLIIWDTREKQPWRTRLKDPMTMFTGVLALGTIAVAVVAALQWLSLLRVCGTTAQFGICWRGHIDPELMSVVGGKAEVTW